MLKFFRIIILAAMISFAGGIGLAEQAAKNTVEFPDPGMADTVRVESFSVSLLYNSFWLDVYLYNDEELRSITVPLKWNSSDITCDSVYFDWSRADYINLKEMAVDNDHQRLYGAVEVVFEPPLEPGYGWFFSLFCRIDSGAVNQIITFDTTIWPPERELELTLTDGLKIYPQFVAGKITLGEMPDSIVTEPERNVYSAPMDLNIKITFPDDILAESITNSSIRFYGLFSGGIEGLLEYKENTRTITFDPVDNLHPGEKIDVIVNSDLENSRGLPVTDGYLSSFTISSGGGSGSFTIKTSTMVDSSPFDIEAADYDRNGEIDLAVSLPDLNTVAIMSNDGQATFDQTEYYNAGLSPEFLTNVDLNNDGFMDIIAAEIENSQVSSLINNGDGSLASPVIMNSVYNIINLGAGDFDIDGYIDIVTCEKDLSNNYYISIYLNDGLGTMTLDSTYTLEYNACNWAIFDFENDNDLDLLIISITGNTDLLQNDGGHFALSNSFPVGENIQDMESGDLNLDGYIDLALVDSNHLYILSNNAGEGFEQVYTYPINKGIYQIALADFNGDYNPDVVLIRNSGGSIMTFYNAGNGIFQPGGGYTIGSNIAGSATADVNNDGSLDLAFAACENGQVIILHNADYICGDANNDLVVNIGDIVFLSYYIFRTGPYPDSAEKADVNCDGEVNVGDIVYLVNFVFVSGSPPCDYCE